MSLVNETGNRAWTDGMGLVVVWGMLMGRVRNICLRAERRARNLILLQSPRAQVDELATF